jgi:acyl-coenzyme A thioesterase PaaI-like protein
VNIVRAVTAQTGVGRATGRIVHRGRRTAVTEARMEDASGKLYAYASATQLVIED